MDVCELRDTPALVVDEFLNALSHSSKNKGDLQSTEAFPSQFFYNYLLFGHIEKIYVEATKRRLLYSDLALFPLQLPTHWVLISVQPRAHLIIVHNPECDSTDHKPSIRYGKKMKKLLNAQCQRETEELRRQGRPPERDPITWDILIAISGLRDQQIYSGIAICKVAEEVVLQTMTDFLGTPQTWDCQKFYASMLRRIKIWKLAGALMTKKDCSC